MILQYSENAKFHIISQQQKLFNADLKLNVASNSLRRQSFIHSYNSDRKGVRGGGDKNTCCVTLIFNVWILTTTKKCSAQYFTSELPVVNANPFLTYPNTGLNRFHNSSKDNTNKTRLTKYHAMETYGLGGGGGTSAQAGVE
jgi:hypothetical protein